MARIQAGSTLVNQYAPPFVVSDSVTQGWELVWSDTLQAFEAVDPSANTIEAGFDEINVTLFENVTQQVFVVNWVADSKESLIVTIDGVKQHQDAYTIITDTDSSTTTVTLSETVTDETVEILGLQTTGGATINLFGPQPIDSNVPGTVNANFDIGWFASSTESLIVTIDGVKQATNNYFIEPAPGSNFTDTRLTFPDRTVTFATDVSGINAATDVITTDTVHGFDTGDGVYYSADGGVEDIGVGVDPTEGGLYYVRALSAFTLALYPTRQDAIDDTSRIDLQVAGAETHALTLIADPYLYINPDTIALVAGGSGYTESDILTVVGGSPVVEAQIRVDGVDNEATFTFDTDGAGAVSAISIVSGGTGYPASGGGTFNITVASDSGFTPGTQALITYTTDGAGVIDSAVVTTPGTGYTINLTGQSVASSDIPNPSLGAISSFTLLFAGEYVAFPTPNPVSVAGGTGTGATFNIFRVSPQIEVVGISTTGETPASPVEAGNLGSPDDTTTFGLYSSKAVTGETQVLNFRSISEGTNITMAVAGDTVQISAANPTLAETTTGGGTSLFDTLDQSTPVWRRLLAGDNIALSVAGADNPIVIAENFNYLSSASATITITTERLVNVLPAGATTVNLPAASSVTTGDKITIKDANGTAATNNIAVTPDGSDNIDGVNSAVTLNTARAYITLYSDGTDWHIIAQG